MPPTTTTTTTTTTSFEKLKQIARHIEIPIQNPLHIEHPCPALWF
jgi:hypothetical protein